MNLRLKILVINVFALACILAVVIFIARPLILNSNGQDTFRVFIAMVVAVGLVSTLVRTLLFEAFVTRRITGLTRRVDHIKKYRSYYEELDYKGKDEVAVLARALNQMLQRIVSSTNEVGTLNARLQEEKAHVEKLVAQRSTEVDVEKDDPKA